MIAGGARRAARRIGDAYDAFLDRLAQNVLALEADRAARGQHAHGGVEQRCLACAIGADDRDDFAARHVDGHAMHRFDLAIGDVKVADGEQQFVLCLAHASAPR